SCSLRRSPLPYPRPVPGTRPFPFHHGEHGEHGENRKRKQGGGGRLRVEVGPSFMATAALAAGTIYSTREGLAYKPDAPAKDLRWRVRLVCHLGPRTGCFPSSRYWQPPTLHHTTIPATTSHHDRSRHSRSPRAKACFRRRNRNPE